MATPTFAIEGLLTSEQLDKLTALQSIELGPVDLAAEAADAALGLTPTKELARRLRARLGIPVSVTCGSGTSRGWGHIRVANTRKKYRRAQVAPGVYEWIRAGQEPGTGNPLDMIRINAAMGHRSQQSIDIPSSTAYWVENLARAAGRTPSKIAQPYWD